jgi:hypothetical protein
MKKKKERRVLRLIAAKSHLSLLKIQFSAIEGRDK